MQALQQQASDPAAVHTRQAFDYEHQHFQRSDLCHFVPARIEELLADVGLPRDWYRGRRVLDAGCGSGRWSYALAELGAHVTAVDFTPAGVAATGAMLAAYPGCRALLADLTTLGSAPPPDGAAALPREGFDLVFSWGVLHHTAQPEATFRELVPYVAPGGWLYVMVYGLTSPLQDRVTDLIRRALRHLSPADRYQACRAFVLDSAPLQQALWPSLYVYYADPADAVAVERATFAAYDCYSPVYNWRYPVPVVARWFARAGLVDVVQTNPHPEAVHLRGRKP